MSMQQMLFMFACPAIANLNGVMLYGKKIHVTLSKHSTVQMPQAGSNVSYSWFALQNIMKSTKVLNPRRSKCAWLATRAI